MKPAKKPFLAPFLLLGAIIALGATVGAFSAYHWALGAFNELLIQDKPLWEHAISQAAGYRVTYERAQVQSLMPPILVIERLQINHPEDQSPLLADDQTVFRLDGVQLLNGRIQIDEIRLRAPRFRFIKHRSGSWNWQRQTTQTGNNGPTLRTFPIRGISALTLVIPQRPSVLLEHPDILLRSNDDADRPFTLAMRLPNLQWACPDIDAPCHLSTQQSADEPANQEPAFEMHAEYDIENDAGTLQISNTDLGLATEGSIRNLLRGASPQFQITLKSRSTAIRSLANVFHHPPAFFDFLGGTLDLELDLVGEGLHPAAIETNMAGEGAFEILTGSLHHMNLIHDLLSELAPAQPSDTPAQPSADTPAWLSRLRNLTETSFDLARGNIKVLQETLRFEQIEMQSSHYLLQANGTYSLRDTSLDLTGTFVLLDQLSHFLLRAYPELRAFESANGRLVVPFRILGIVPHPSLTVLRKLIYENQSKISKIPQTHPTLNKQKSL